MSIKQRRNSQRLAAALDALSNDLVFTAKQMQEESNQEMTTSNTDADAYWQGKLKGRDAIQCLGSDDQEVQEQEVQEKQDPEVQEQEVQEKQDPEVQEQDDGQEQNDQEEQEDFEQEDFEQDQEQEDDQEEESIGSVLQGDPGVDEVGSHATYDTDNVRGLGKGYGIDFDGDSDLQSSIRNVPGKTAKQARIKKLIARIENVANELECTGRKSLAYRLDIVCNNLQKKYLNK